MNGHLTLADIARRTVPQGDAMASKKGKFIKAKAKAADAKKPVAAKDTAAKPAPARGEKWYGGKNG